MQYADMAGQVQSRGRGDDTMLIHMTPKEVGGLQALALKSGGSLSVNPETGLLEAGWLGKLLPTILGIASSFIPGVGPLMAAGIIGAGGAAVTGDLGKGLMAGLQAFGGASLAGAAGLGAAGNGATSGITAAKEVATNAAKQVASTGANVAGAALPGTPAAFGFGSVGAGAGAGASAASGAGAGIAKQVAANALKETVAQQAAKTGIGGFLGRFGDAAQQGLGGSGMLHKAAPMLAATGVMQGLSAATTPNLRTLDDARGADYYDGPYTARRPKPVYPGANRDPKDSSEFNYFPQPIEVLDRRGGLYVSGQEYPKEAPAPKKKNFLGFAEGGGVENNGSFDATDMFSVTTTPGALGRNSVYTPAGGLPGLPPPTAALPPSTPGAPGINTNYIQALIDSRAQRTPPPAPVTPPPAPPTSPLAPGVTPEALRLGGKGDSQGTGGIWNDYGSYLQNGAQNPYGFGQPPGPSPTPEYMSPGAEQFAPGGGDAFPGPMEQGVPDRRAPNWGAGLTMSSPEFSQDFSAFSPQQSLPTPQPMTLEPYEPSFGGGSEGPFGGSGGRLRMEETAAFAQGGAVGLSDGAFVVDARTVAELGNGSSSAGREILMRLGGKPVDGAGDGVSDSVPASIDGAQPAQVARDEVVFDPEAIARIGGGDHNKGTKMLYDLMKRAEKSRKKAKRGQDTNVDKGLPVV